MFNFNANTIIAETIGYLIVSVIIKIALMDEEYTSIRRILLIGYLIFSSLFISLTVFIIVSVAIVILTFGIKRLLEY
ncbi:hypothetical protein DESAMIL20_291 [Desulfurella amilsii]|jgi:hypothetical protein|uniref:Uncharacterized protein n=1 Tax=Desulfurella amilsii TaxID=1562698 RepID=A0A1X4XZ90_9BACT|nr:hypothetical protein [Desulfurella amilsii]OSS42861.1 hypothetical protein DESAMIL20_291 [Desulfurella amilsii]